MNILVKFSAWYSNNIEKSILVTLLVLLLQVPHFIWGGDVLLQTGYIANVNPIYDFILYGVDLLEIPLIIKTAVDFIVLRKSYKKKVKT